MKSLDVRPIALVITAAAQTCLLVAVEIGVRRGLGPETTRQIAHVIFFSSRRLHTIFYRDWSSDVCSSDLRELVMNVNIPAGLLICGALVILAFFITQRIIPLGFLLTRDSLSIALAILMIGFFTMIARKKA